MNAGDPRQAGPYLLLRRLGGGGMGTVYLARRQDSSWRVAVKVIHSALLEADPQFKVRFAREIEHARRVEGRYTARIVDADVDAPVPWMASEYIQGNTLDVEVAAGGPFSAQALVELAAGTAEALAAIHAAGLVHRDLKPSNVILAADGPRVIDFGIAHGPETTRLTQPGTTLGTMSYMSPEHLSGEGVQPASDVFSLGGVLCFAATGHSPFPGAGYPEAIHRILAGEPDLGGIADPWVRQLVAACLAKRPQDRPGPDRLRLLCTQRLTGPGSAPAVEPAQPPTTAAPPTPAPAAAGAPVPAGATAPAAIGGTGPRPGPTAGQVRQRVAEVPGGRLAGPEHRRRRAWLITGAIVAVAALVATGVFGTMSRGRDEGLSPSPSNASTPSASSPSGAGGSSRAAACGTVRVAMNSWPGYRADAAVFAYLARTRLGCEVVRSELTEQEAWQGIAAGQVDLLLEDWGHVDLARQYITEQKVAVDLGTTGNHGAIGWYVPPWLAEAHPDVLDWRNLNRYADRFATSRSGGKGQLLVGDPSYVTNDEALVKNLGLDFAVVRGDNEGALVQALRTAQARRTWLLVYFYEPHWLFTELPLARVSLPAYEKGCDAVLAAVACDYPRYDLTKVARADFVRSGGPAATLAANFRWTNEDQNTVARYLEVDGMSDDAAAERWVRANPDKVNAWLGT